MLSSFTSLSHDTKIIVQVCWIPIFKAEKLILAGDPMQLPPTVISLDKKKEKRKDKKSQNQADTRSEKEKPQSLGKPVPPAPETESDSESVDEKPAGTSDNEDDSGLAADPKLSLSVPVKDPRKAGAKSLLRPPRSLETTLFERLEKMYGPGIKRMLTVQYRYAIASLPP